MRNFANYQVDIRHRTSGVIKTICNQCLPTRHNKRDRSLRVNIDTGHCHCYHCGADFYVPDDTEEREKAERQAARKRRAAAVVPQHFQRPVFDASKTTLSDATERWLVETRCIPQSVIAELRITEQEEFMPQFGAKERCVCFNYFEGGQLVNTKFRSGKKHFKMVQGAELIPYNIDSLIGQTSCIIHEGEFDEVIPQISSHVKSGCVIVSIAAGKTIAAIEDSFGKPVKLVRAMPNTPALVGEAMSALCVNQNVTPEELKEVQALFNSFGKSEVISESLMDAVIGVSGSSPAYVYMFIEAMADAAVADGMPRAQAYKFAAQSVYGSAKMVLETGKHPGELKDAVCSPAGTTIEAVAALEAGGFRNTVISAQRACSQKSRDMSAE